MKMIHLPRHGREWILFMIFWLGGLWTVYYEFFFVVRSYHNHWNGAVYFHIVLAGFLAFNIYSSMYLMISTDVSVNQIHSSEGSVRPGWKYCEKCSVNTPPRSHHCKLCDICILKRDHHCWFAGYCVGYHNHRYFFCLALYMSIAGIYANIYNWEFFTNEKGGFTWTTIPALLAPHVGLCFGYYTMYEFFLTINTSLGLFCTILFLGLLYFHAIQIARGQVMYEKKKGINDYNLDLRNALNEVFGSAGLLVLLCPFICTTFPGDGTHFPSYERKAQ